MTDHAGAARSAAHLALLNRPAPLTAREFNSLPFAARLDLVRLAQGRQKYQLLLDAADGPALAELLPAQELYLLVRELGPEDVPELLLLASNEQLTCFLDLDCWQGEALVPKRVLRWLALLLEAGEERLLAAARELEYELLVLLLRSQVRVVSGPEEIEDEDVRIEAIRRDGGYQLEYAEPEGAKIVAAFLDVLFRHDQDLYLRLLEGVRWEVAAQLEEEAYALRAGRLLDLGFPEPTAARAVYAWFDPERFAASAEPKRPTLATGDAIPPGFVLTAARPQGVLATVLAAGLDDAAAWELSYLVNKVLFADQVDPGEPRQVRQAVARVGQLLNLALEFLAGGDPQRAAELFARHYHEHLFRLGFSLTLRLQRRASAVAARPAGAFLDAPFRSVVEALQRPLPVYYEGLDGRGRGGERPFAVHVELQRAEAALAGIEAQCRLFEGGLPFPLPTAASCDLAGCVPGRVADLTLGGLLFTALGNRILGRECAPIPLAEGELVELQRRLSRDGRLAPVLRDELMAWLTGLEPGSGDFAAWCLDRWEEEFCALPPEQLDPRFLGGLIVRRGR